MISSLPLYHHAHTPLYYTMKQNSLICRMREKMIVYHHNKDKLFFTEKVQICHGAIGKQYVSLFSYRSLFKIIKMREDPALELTV